MQFHENCSAQTQVLFSTESRGITTLKRILDTMLKRDRSNTKQMNQFTDVHGYVSWRGNSTINLQTLKVK